MFDKINIKYIILTVIPLNLLEIPPGVKKRLPSILMWVVVLLICGSMLYMQLYPTSSNLNAKGLVIEPRKWDDNTYYFAATGPDWPVSKTAFFKKHPELDFVGASPDNTGHSGLQVGTWMYVKPK